MTSLIVALSGNLTDLRWKLGPNDDDITAILWTDLPWEVQELRNFVKADLDKRWDCVNFNFGMAALCDIRYKDLAWLQQAEINSIREQFRTEFFNIDEQVRCPYCFQCSSPTIVVMMSFSAAEFCVF